MTTEVGTGFVSIIPSTRGFAPALQQQLGGPADAAGLAAGRRAGGGMARGLGTAALGAGVAAGAALIGGAAKGLSDRTAFDQQLREVLTLLPDASASTFDDMDDQVRGFAQRFGVLPQKVVPALYDAISAGVPPGNVFEFLETSQRAARGGVTDLGTAVDGISSVVNAYGDDVIDAAGASDAMFTAVRLGKTNFEELSRSLFNVTPTASALGVKFGDVTASLATLTAQGTPTSVATTQMRSLFVELSKAGSGAAEVFEDAAGKSFQEFIAEGGNVQDALGIMSDAADEGGGTIADLFGSVEAGAAAAALTSESGAAAFTNALGEMENSTGATTAAFDTMNQGLGPIWDRIKARGATALLSIGEALTPVAAAVLTFAEDTVPRIAAALQPVVDTVARIGGEVIPVVVEAFQFVADLVGDVAATFTSSGDEVSVWADRLGALLESVVGYVTAWWSTVRAVFQTVVRVVSALWARFGDTIVSHIRTSLGVVMDVVAGAFDVVRGIFDAATAVLTGDWSAFGSALRTIWDGLWRIVTATLRGAWSTIRTVFAVATGAIRAVWDGFLGLLGRLWAAAWDGITSRLSSALGTVRDLVSGLPGRILGWLGNLRSLLGDAGADLVRGLWDGIRGMGSWLFDRIIGFVTSNIPGPIARALGLSSPSKVAAALLEEVPRGMVVGMRRGTDDVRNAALGLARASLPPVADVPVSSQPPTLAPGTRHYSATGGVPGPLVHIDRVELADSLDAEAFARQLGMALAQAG